jgi:hypothetical protein
LPESDNHPFLKQHNHTIYDGPAHVHIEHDDRPDVEFNDDGSVHINTPGDYHFLTDFNNHQYVSGWRRLDEQWNWRRLDPDDPALD